MSPRQAIKQYCLWCVTGQRKEIKLCDIQDCALFPFKDGQTIVGNSKLKAIKNRCKQCSIENTVKSCKHKDCPLHSMRFGKRPEDKNKPKRKISQEHLEKLKQGRLSKQS